MTTDILTAVSETAEVVAAPSSRTMRGHGKIATRTDVSNCTTIDMVLSASGTDWEPKLVRPEIPGATTDGFALVNPSNGQSMGFVGKRYSPNSHTEHLRALSGLVQAGDILPVSVSSWDNGAMLAYQFRMPGLSADIAPGRTLSSLLTLAFWHGGTGADRVFLCDFNWFCKNQMGMVRKASEGMSVRHSGFNRERYAGLLLNQARAMGEGASARYAQFARMTGRQLKGLDVLSFFAESLGAKDPGEVVAELQEWAKGDQRKEPTGLARNVRDVVADYRRDDAGAPLSVWHAFNGLTRYLTHTAGRNADLRSRSALMGPSASLIDAAYARAVQLAA